MESRKLGNIYGFDGGNYAGNVYDKNDIAPTLTNMQGGNRQPMIIEEVVRIGGLYDKPEKTHQMGSVFDKECLAPTIDTMQGGYREPMIIDKVKELGFMDNVNTENIIIGGEQEHQAIKKDGVCTTLTSSMGTGGGYVPMVVSEQSIVAMRGGNPENPSDRKVGAPTEQRLEPNSQGICNTLTSVTKDNLVMETASFCVGGLQEHQVPRTDGISPSLTAAMGMGGGQTPLINCQYRIRKLTPSECYRLMAVPEESIDKMLEVNSNTQCYKQAGNSIVVNCLIAIFSQMGIQGIPRWNEGLSEKYK